MFLFFIRVSYCLLALEFQRHFVIRDRVKNGGRDRRNSSPDSHCCLVFVPTYGRRIFEFSLLLFDLKYFGRARKCLWTTRQSFRKITLYLDSEEFCKLRFLFTLPGVGSKANQTEKRTLRWWRRIRLKLKTFVLNNYCLITVKLVSFSLYWHFLERLSLLLLIKYNIQERPCVLK